MLSYKEKLSDLETEDIEDNPVFDETSLRHHFALYTSFCSFLNRCCKSDWAIDDRISFTAGNQTQLISLALSIEIFANNSKMLFLGAIYIAQSSC